MGSSRPGARRPGRRYLRVAAAAGGGMAAAMISICTAHADPASTDPIGLLDSAAADLAQADGVLSNADVPASLQQLLSAQTHSASAFAQLITQAQSIQDPLLSSDNSSVSGFANLLFGNIDQQFAQDSAALLSADQTFAADPSDAAVPGLLVADLQLDSAAIDSLSPELAGVFLDRLLGIAVPIEHFGAAGADLATGFSPDFLF